MNVKPFLGEWGSNLESLEKLWAQLHGIWFSLSTRSLSSSITLHRNLLQLILKPLNSCFWRPKMMILKVWQSSGHVLMSFGLFFFIFIVKMNFPASSPCSGHQIKLHDQFIVKSQQSIVFFSLLQSHHHCASRGEANNQMYWFISGEVWRRAFGGEANNQTSLVYLRRGAPSCFIFFSEPIFRNL